MRRAFIIMAIWLVSVAATPTPSPTPTATPVNLTTIAAKLPTPTPTAIPCSITVTDTQSTAHSTSDASMEYTAIIPLGHVFQISTIGTTKVVVDGITFNAPYPPVTANITGTWELRTTGCVSQGIFVTVQ